MCSPCFLYNRSRGIVTSNHLKIVLLSDNGILSKDNLDCCLFPQAVRRVDKNDVHSKRVEQTAIEPAPLINVVRYTDNG